MTERRVISIIIVFALTVVAVVAAAWTWNGRFHYGYGIGKRDGLALRTTATVMTTVITASPGPTLVERTVTVTVPTYSSTSSTSISPSPSSSSKVAATAVPDASALEHGVLLPSDVATLSLFGASDSFSSAPTGLDFTESGNLALVLEYGIGNPNADLSLCKGRSVPRSKLIVQDVNGTWSNSGAFTSTTQGWGTDMVSFKTAAAALAQYNLIYDKARDCTPTVSRTKYALGDQAFQTSVAEPDGTYNDQMFVLLGNVMMQVGLTTSSGQHAVGIQSLATLAVQKYEASG